MNISKENLEKKRTPEELYEFVQKSLSSISKDEQSKKEARLRKNGSKELIEEVYPLSIFCRIKYNGKDVICYPVIGSQGYDARVETQDGELVEVIELTWPIDGQKEYLERKKLNEQGYTEVEVWDYNDKSKQQEVIDITLDTANKKAVKIYETPEGSSLVFILGIAPYFGMSKIDNQGDIDRLVEELRKIEYRVWTVYLLLLPINQLIEIKSRGRCTGGRLLTGQAPWSIPSLCFA